MCWYCTIRLQALFIEFRILYEITLDYYAPFDGVEGELKRKVLF